MAPASSAACGAGSGAFATGAALTSTSSTSGIPSNAARTSSGGRVVASSAVTRTPPFFCISAAGCGSISSRTPSPFNFRCTIRLRAPGAWHALESEKATSSLGVPGSATGFCPTIRDAGSGASRSGRTRDASASLAASASGAPSSARGAWAVPDACCTSCTSSSVACSSRSTCVRSGFACCAFSLPISVSAAWAMATTPERPMVAALPFTECTRRKIESQSAPPGTSCSILTSSEASCSSCSVASATKACRYLWGACAMTSTRRAPSSPPRARPLRERA